MGSRRSLLPIARIGRWLRVIGSEPVVGSVTARRGSRASSGFTLVEILVVLVVVGIGLGLVTLTIGHDGTATLRHESERLRSALEHGAQLAQWRHSTLLWEADATGYRFSTLAADGTLAEETDPTLAWHALPPDIRMRVTDASGVSAPLRLVLRASGRNDPYAIAIESGAGAWTIAGDPLNRVRAAPAARASP